MQDKELYQQVLGLTAPWSIQRVELNMAEQRVDIHVEHDPAAKWCCPECERSLSCYDHAEERTWRHLDTCQLQTHLHARIPRVKCPEHGVLRVSVPWAEPHSRFTMLFERLIIDVLQECQHVSGTQRLLGISWDQAFGVMERAVKRGQARKEAEVVRHVGVDEKAFRKGHMYMTIVTDLERGCVEYVAEDRGIASLAGYFQSLTADQRNGIEAVAMDMWEPYVQATLQHLPLAEEKIVFDRFHIMKHMNDAVDKVRRMEHRQLLAEGDETLKRSKYLWLYAQENVPEQQKDRFEALKDQVVQTSRAWGLKEMLRELWECGAPGWARKFFKRWYAWASRCRLKPVIKVAQMIRKRLENVISYCKHFITSGVAEGINRKIMTIKRQARGFRNKDNFKNAIYFYCGDLNLYPL